MPCLVCDQTIQRVNSGTNPKTWWCPRCGTLKIDGVPENESPKLVLHAIALMNAAQAVLDSEPSAMTFDERERRLYQAINLVREATEVKHVPY